MTMRRPPYRALLPQFSIIVEKNGVEISRDILSATNAVEARATFLGLAPIRFFDPQDRSLRCRVESLKV
jgi:hypothetical protein